MNYSDNTATSSANTISDYELAQKLKAENIQLWKQNKELADKNKYLSEKVNKMQQTLDVKDIILKKKLASSNDVTAYV